MVTEKDIEKERDGESGREGRRVMECLLYRKTDKRERKRERDAEGESSRTHTHTHTLTHTHTHTGFLQRDDGVGNLLPRLLPKV